ncbi:MAG: hydrogenase subunit MbhD domain-containing protein [Solirubrobacteraceae bacterium]
MSLAALQAATLVLLAVAGAAVVQVRDPLRQVIALGLYGLVLAVLFLLFQAPDVALSQIVIGSLGLPLMFLLALAKVSGREK